VLVFALKIFPDGKNISIFLTGQVFAAFNTLLFISFSLINNKNYLIFDLTFT